jgi:hypothetical protein
MAGDRQFPLLILLLFVVALAVYIVVRRRSRHRGSHQADDADSRSRREGTHGAKDQEDPAMTEITQLTGLAYEGSALPLTAERTAGLVG